MKRVLFALGMAAPVLALACSGSPDDPAGSSGENLNWRGDLDGAATAFDGAPRPFPGFRGHLEDGGFPFVLPDGATPFEIPDGGFGAPPPWFKWHDGKFHMEPTDGGFKFALPMGGFACPDEDGGFTFEGKDGGFTPPPDRFDGGFIAPIFGDSDAGHHEEPHGGGRP